MGAQLTLTMVHFIPAANTWTKAAPMVLGEARNPSKTQTTSFVGRAYAGDPSYCVQMTPGNIPDLLEQGPAFKSQINSRTVNTTANCAARGYNSQVANPELAGKLITYGAWFHK